MGKAAKKAKNLEVKKKSLKSQNRRQDEVDISERINTMDDQKSYQVTYDDGTPFFLPGFHSGKLWKEILKNFEEMIKKDAQSNNNIR